MTTTQILEGDCIETLKTIPAGSVQTAITSPPYFNLRDYQTASWEGGDPACDHIAPPAGGTGEKSKLQVEQKRKDFKSGIYKDTCGKCGAVRIDDQIGLEETPEAYVAKLVTVFREVYRTLAKDGTLWLNLGDSYAGSGKGPTGTNRIGDQEIRQGFSGSRGSKLGSKNGDSGHTSGVTPPDGYKAKDLIGIPWMVALALRADGWYLRSDIIWAKRNPMPESVTDRPTKAHEYIFLLSKSAKYYYDAESILEPATEKNWGSRLERESKKSFPQGGRNGIRTHKNLQPDGQQPNSFHLRRADGLPDEEYSTRNKRSVWTVEDDGLARWLEWYAQQPEFETLYERYAQEMRNKSDVWDVTTKPYKGAHFATFPPDLIEPCVLAGSREGDIVLDPFNGSGTTGAVAIKHHRNYIGCELNPEYVKLTRKRFSQVQPVLFPTSP